MSRIVPISEYEPYCIRQEPFSAAGVASFLVTIDRDRISKKRPVMPKDGEVFVYENNGRFVNWKEDGYEWKHQGVRKYPKKDPIMIKTYYVQTVGGTATSFHRFKFTLIRDSSDVLVHYLDIRKSDEIKDKREPPVTEATEVSVAIENMDNSAEDVETCGEDNKDQGVSDDVDDISNGTQLVTGNKFLISLPWDTFQSIKPKGNALRLGGNYTDILYEKFGEVWPTCPLKFQNNRVVVNSCRKRPTPYCSVYAVCNVGTCIKVKFILPKIPDQGSDAIFQVIVEGRCTHLRHVSGQENTEMARGTAKLLKRKLRGQTNGDVANDHLPIIPNYLQNPPFPYSSPSSQKVNECTMSSISTSKSTLASSAQVSTEVILKVRIADSAEKDFIEIDLPCRSLTYSDLLSMMCTELGTSAALVQKVRKLPNTIVRCDKDVQRLNAYQELELVLSSSPQTHETCPIRNSFQNYRT